VPKPSVLLLATGTSLASDGWTVNGGSTGNLGGVELDRMWIGAGVPMIGVPFLPSS